MRIEGQTESRYGELFFVAEESRRGVELIYCDFSPWYAEGNRIPAALGKKLERDASEEPAGSPQADPVHIAKRLRSFLDERPGRRAADPTSEELFLPLQLYGSEFQQAVWKALLTIPYGELRSYGDIAKAIGRPAAVRAVGTAVGTNPLAPIVPCHRVVPAGGGIGNYGSGPEKKRQLLELEGAL